MKTANPFVEDLGESSAVEPRRHPLSLRLVLADPVPEVSSLLGAQLGAAGHVAGRAPFYSFSPSAMHSSNRVMRFLRAAFAHSFVSCMFSPLSHAVTFFGVQPGTQAGIA